MSVISTASVVIVILAQAAVGLVLTNSSGEPECLTNHDCPNNNVCWQERCFDPCVLSVCGQNTICSVSNHMAICSCHTGFTGYPLTGCQPPAEPECDTNKPCPSDRTCVGERCIDPCQMIVCGKNTPCHTANHTASCTCPLDHTWDPAMGCQQVSAGVPECDTNKPCPSDRTCIIGRCIDPCQFIVCGKNTLCHAANHTASCICPHGHLLDPLNGCQQLPAATTVKEVTPKKKQFRLNLTSRMIWIRALAHCHSQGMHLASLDNEEEYNELVTLIKQANITTLDFWLSGTDMGEDGVYMWVSRGVPVSYTNWSPGEPNHKNIDGEAEHCIELRTGGDYKMNDDRCSKSKLVVCELYN